MNTLLEKREMQILYVISGLTASLWLRVSKTLGISQVLSVMKVSFVV